MFISAQPDALSLPSSSGFENVLASTLTTQNMPRRSRTSQNPSNSGASGSAHNNAIATWTDYATDESIIHNNRNLYSEEAPILASWLPDNARVLDLGAGNGISSLSLANEAVSQRKTFRIKAVDMIPKEPFLEQKRNYPQQAQDMVTYKRSKIENFNFETGFGTYSFVSANRILPYLEQGEQLKAVTNIVGSLTPTHSGTTFEVKEGTSGAYEGQIHYPLDNSHMTYIRDLFEWGKFTVDEIPAPDQDSYKTIRAWR